MGKSNTETTERYEARGTIQQERDLRGALLDAGTWNEEGCQNPILYFTEQEGMKQKVVFDLAPAHYDTAGEGPLTITAHLEVTSYAGEPSETLVDKLVLFVQGMEKQELSRETSLFERFSGAAIKIAAAHFNRLSWDSAYEDSMDAPEDLDGWRAL
jgi:hypothetical protein